MEPEERIKITYFTPLTDDRSSVIGLFGCYLVKQDLYFAKWKLIIKKDGSLFAAPPSEKYQDPKTGKDAYANFCWFGSKFGEEFQKAVLESIKSYCARKGIPLPVLSQPSVFNEPLSPPDQNIPGW